MAFSLTRFSCWLWSGRGGDERSASSSPNFSSSSDFGMGFEEAGILRFPPPGKARPGSRRAGRKCRSRDEGEKVVDKEHDVVIVPSDGGCLSGSESDGSDWSIGWLEPHSTEFQSDTESENSFAVLVPCYGRGRCEQVESPKQRFLRTAAEFPISNTSLQTSKLCGMQFIYGTVACFSPTLLRDTSKLESLIDSLCFVEQLVLCFFKNILSCYLQKNLLKKKMLDTAKQTKKDN